MLKEFKQFLLRGNVVDLAVGLMMGAAFGTVVTSLVTDIFTPLLAGLVSIPDFSEASFAIGESQVMYGSFLNACISLIIMATTVFFFIVKPINALVARSRKEPPVDPTTKKCEECCSEVPIDATRRAFCTQAL